jgi:hypothetical protein
MPQNEPENPTICGAHTDLIASMAALCTNLKWLTRLGFAMVPVSLYLLSQMVELKQQVATHASQLTHMASQIAKLMVP